MINLTEKDNFILRFEQTVRECWDMPALNEFRSEAITYGQLGAEIIKTHLLWKAAGLSKGEKIAINARSSAEWAKVFMAAQAGGYVAVQLFNGFTPDDTTKLTVHSDSRILYTEKMIFDKMDFEQMPELLGAIDLHSGKLLASRGNFAEVYENRDSLFAEAYPKGITPEDICFDKRSLDDLSAIMYTSGSTGNPKGVMLSCRNFSANVYLIEIHFPYRRGDNYVSVLPYAHIFGLVFDMVAPLCYGLHLVILFVPPVPANLKPALREFRPHVFFAVPLILTKLIEDVIGEFIHSKSGAARLADYENNPDFCEALNTIFMKALGDNIEVFVTGGAAMPEALEKLLALQLKLPFVTGYGMTEACPTIALGHVGHYKLKSCGEYVDEVVECKIMSEDQEKIAGELYIKGSVVFDGYYKNEAATREVFTEDGWFRTGDVGVIDSEKTVFLSGRCKNMILSTNGQNIFPEEIEVVLNALPYVAESIVVERENGKLIALVVPNMTLLEEHNLDSQALENAMAKNIEMLNEKIPAYSAVTGYELRFEPFAKTPKGSIRRFMYK